jgi:hypothetical protein
MTSFADGTCGAAQPFMAPFGRGSLYGWAGRLPAFDPMRTVVQRDRFRYSLSSFQAYGRELRIARQHLR